VWNGSKGLEFVADAKSNVEGAVGAAAGQPTYGSIEGIEEFTLPPSDLLDSLRQLDYRRDPADTFGDRSHEGPAVGRDLPLAPPAIRRSQRRRSGGPFLEALLCGVAGFELPPELKGRTDGQPHQVVKLCVRQSSTSGQVELGPQNRGTVRTCLDN
jgi:hypothetical protein